MNFCMHVLPSYCCSARCVSVSLLSRQALSLTAMKLIWCDHNNTHDSGTAEGEQDWSDHSRRIDLTITGPTKALKI